jgi:manganese-dependent ADP-ribose/CDP-alcohol diphosphatase
MKRQGFTVIFIFLVTASAWCQQQGPVVVGILSDCQYCDCDRSGERYYRLSLQKLDSCVDDFNSQSLSAVFHLGDMIDRGFGNYDSVLPRFRRFNAPLYMVLGNHDYMIKSEYKPGLLDFLGMKAGYYRVDFGGWTFVVLNGDDLSFVAPQSREQKKERNEIVDDLYSSLKPNALFWNGGIGSVQMKWLEEQLSDARSEGQKVIIVCHFPIFSRKDHNLFNRFEVYNLISSYACVKAYFCGHYHEGSYTERGGIHFVNFKGMVNDTINAYATVRLTQDSILIDGAGREPDRRLGIRP